MSAFRTNIILVDVTEQIGFGATLNADGSILSIDGPTLRRVTAAPTQTDNAGSLALRTNGTLYMTAGAGVWFPIGGPGSGWHLPDDVNGIWGTAVPGQVTSVYVSASNRWDLTGDNVTDAATTAMRIRTGIATDLSAVAAASGLIEINTGRTETTGAGDTGGTSGAITVGTGDALSTPGGTSGSTGVLTLSTGNSDDANSGNIALTVGTAASGTRGSIELSALRVHTNDDIPFSVGTLANDRFEFSYALGTTQGQILGTSITAVGSVQATRPLSIATGARISTDATGSPASGAISISSGQTTAQSAAGGLTGGVSGNVSIGTGATNSTLGANTGGASGNLSLTTGAASSTLGTSGASGTVQLASGTSEDANTGNVSIGSGNAAAAGAIVSGNVAISSGTVGGTGTTGTISFTTGNPAGAGVSGPITATTGTTTGAANTGLISLTTGGTGTGTTGAITFATGAATGAGTSGNITLTPGTVVGGTRGQVVALGLRTIGSTAVAITGATTLTLADSGGVFNIDQDAAFDIDLPSPTVGPGLRFLFVVGDAGANTVTITVLGGAATFIGNIVNDVTSVISIAGTETSINIINATAALGDTIEIVSISTTLYLVRAVTSTAGGITAT